MPGKHFEWKNYITYDKDRDVSICLKCAKEMKGKFAGNIKRHYRMSHKANFDFDASSKVNGVQISVNMTKNEFIQCCMGLVTVQNLPFQFFEHDQYLKKLIAPYEKKFGVIFNSATIAQNVRNIANKLKENLFTIAKSQMVCLKLDVVTSLEKKCGLGILTIQYIKDFKLIINTIGVLQLSHDDSEMILKREIIQCLKGANIDISQIYSCTPGGAITDIGPNVLKAAILLKELQEAWLIDNEGWDSTDESGEEDEDYTLTHILAVVRCAEHNVQLAADDVFEACKSNINECRSALKQLKMTDCNINRIDDTNKWNLLYIMFKDLENLRNFVNNLDVSIPEIDWTFVSDFICAFNPLYNCAQKFDSKQYILGDFYRDWLICEIELEEIVTRNGCAQLLLEAMGNRKVRFLENDAFLSALYVDPRFNFVNTPFLTMEQKDIAMRHLLNTNSLIKLLGNDPTTKISYEYSIPSSTLANTSSSYHKLERKMRRMAGVSMTNKLGKSMEQKLENLSFSEWSPFDTNILEYWKKCNTADPQLLKLVQVVLSVPVTQVPEDASLRALSVLKHASSEMSKQTINDLLMVKLNNIIFKNIETC